MPQYGPWAVTFREAMHPSPLPMEDRLERAAFLRMLFHCRSWPAQAMELIAGIVEPVHQRTMLRVANRGAGTNVNISSRGTSKSATTCVQLPVYKSFFWMRVKSVLLSASGFRGGQGVFTDMLRMIKGGWDSQRGNLTYMQQASSNPKILHRAANFWAWSLSNFSEYRTLPTKDPDSIRGERANQLFVDEANFANDGIIERVAKPFLNVRGDFAHGGAYSSGNSVFYTTTIDYVWRPFGKVQDAALDELREDYAALEARERGDTERYLERSKAGFAKYTYICFDYTDTFIRQTGRTRDGRNYRVKYPNKRYQLTERPNGIPYTERHPSGMIRKLCTPVRGWSTYPIDFEAVESGLYDGSVPDSSWLSEARNVRDVAQGDVFTVQMLDEVVFTGDRYLIDYADCPKDYQEAYAEDQRDYAPTVMYTCSDPCVLGVDYAGGDRDFCAFVVIRMGPLASGAFSPLTGHGKTPWSNVIWAEQHRLMSHEQTTEKIFQMAERYNLHYFHAPGLEDDWRVCRAIGLDMRGGGVGVRDNLVYINRESLKPNEYRIYDPLDTDPRVQAFALDQTAKPMLDAISPTDQLNDKLVEFLYGQFDKQLLYLPKHLHETMRVGHQRADVTQAFNHVRILEYQLRKIQQEPTKNARRFYMAGDTDRTDRKKDLFSALLYAGKQLRTHLLRERMAGSLQVTTNAERTEIGVQRRVGIQGRKPGAKM